MRLALVFVAVLTTSSCAPHAPRASVTADAVTETDSNLGPGDVFEVSVYGERDLSGKYRVAEDGSIDFPLVGRVEVAGKGPSEIAEAIRTALKNNQILKSPNVSVFLVEQNSKRVAVMGAVAKPGSYPLTAGMTVIQAIGAAGGITAIAAGSDAVLTRTAKGERKRFKVDIDGITEGRAEDVRLQAGDIIYVPERVF